MLPWMTLRRSERRAVLTAPCLARPPSPIPTDQRGAVYLALAAPAMRSLVVGALLPLVAAVRLTAQLPFVPDTPPRVSVVPNDAWLCRQTAGSLDESTLLGRAILARVDSSPDRDASSHIDFRRGHGRLGAAIAAFAIDRDRGVIYVNDSTDGGTLLHEITHALLLRVPPDAAESEIAAVLAADSAGTLDPDVVDMARRSFTLSFTASADPALWGLVPMVLTSAALRDSSTRGTFGRLILATDSAAVHLEGSVSKGWGRATIADAYEAAANSHWRYAGAPRPSSWTWRTERTFRLVGEATAYARAKACKN
jgi:hypothetical protein